MGLCLPKECNVTELKPVESLISKIAIEPIMNSLDEYGVN